MGRIIMAFVMLGVLFMGGAAFINGVRLIFQGDPNQAGAIAATIIGLVLSAAALAYFYWAVALAPIEKARLERIRARYPGQPWMERPEWATRKLTSSSRGPAILMWIWVAGWWFFIGLIGTVNRHKILAALQESWWNWLVLAIFVGAGLIGLSFALSFTRHALRYGTSTLELHTLPAYMGDRFAGTLTARLDPLPRVPLKVELACEDLEWVTSGHGNDRRSRLAVRPLGRSTSTADATRFTPSRDGVRVRIEIDVPARLPASFRDEGGNGIRWSLRISTADGDAPFSCEFEIPVFERGPHL